MPAKVKATVLAYAGVQAVREEQREIDPSALAGNYYVGDGLGYNLHLVLGKDRKFECTWTGCLGVYGQASGAWSLDEKGLSFSQDKGTGTLQSPAFDRLRIVVFRGRYLLLKDCDRRRFEEYGPNASWCFHREEDRKVLNEEFRRGLLERAKKPASPDAAPQPAQHQRDEASLREEARRRKEALPKVVSTINRVVVYRDAVIVSVSTRNETDAPLRLRLTTEAFWMRGSSFVDKDGNSWAMPRLASHYYLVEATTKNTVLLGAGKTVNYEVVNSLEDPTLQLVKKGSRVAPNKPRLREYDFVWIVSAYPKDLAKQPVMVHRIAKGTTKVEWKEKKLPEGTRSRVLDEPSAGGKE
jgi:hypothetical protein